MRYSTANHPQSDGQTEVVNRTLETFGRCFACEKPRMWSKYLSWAEYAYNTSHHSSIDMTPFEALYGYPPPNWVTYEHGSSKVLEVDQQLRTRDDIFSILKRNMLKAQTRMKQIYDRGRQDREFNEGEWVWLKRLPKGKKELFGRPYSKLLPKYYGPFKVEQRIGRAAYRLNLPPTAKVHPVFHVSRLKPYHSPPWLLIPYLELAGQEKKATQPL
jgi:hypothetical protein